MNNVSNERRSVKHGNATLELSIVRYLKGASGVVVYMHGGGWVKFDSVFYMSTLATLARNARTTVISIDYRLAPEHPFPAPFDDCVAAYEWAVDHAAEYGGERARVSVAGDRYTLFRAQIWTVEWVAC